MSRKIIGCVIDDDQIYLFGVSRLIEIHRLCDALLIYKNGQEALEAFKTMLLHHEALPDVIMLDLNMPVMDGWEFLEEFVKIKPRAEKQITIYIVSSSINPKEIERARNITDVSDYVVKPVTADKLKEIFTGEAEE